MLRSRSMCTTHLRQRLGAARHWDQWRHTWATLARSGAFSWANTCMSINSGSRSHISWLLWAPPRPDHYRHVSTSFFFPSPTLPWFFFSLDTLLVFFTLCLPFLLFCLLIGWLGWVRTGFSKVARMGRLDRPRMRAVSRWFYFVSTWRLGGNFKFF